MLAQRQTPTQLPPLPKPQTITTTPPPQNEYPQKSKPLYIEPEAPKEQPVNIMYDRRIHRGSTYASPVFPTTAQADPLLQHAKQLKNRQRRARRKQKEQADRDQSILPVSGRKHVDIQTDLYLEEISDKIPEAVAATQTDLFLDRAPSPLYIPQKSGVDVATQIYEGEVFDFDQEVLPILEVLVGKTIEQSLMEVMEEEELEFLRRRQIDFEESRNAELSEVQRLEDAERRRTEEKDRRLAEQIRILKEKQEAAEKIAARAFAQSYLRDLIPSVFDSLSANGYFHDIVEKEVEMEFLPWLAGETEKSMAKLLDAQAIVDDIIRNAIRNNKMHKN
jgi:hypothetical protein